MTVKIKKLVEDAVWPVYAHGPEQDAGMDLHAVADVVLKCGVPTLVKTGLSIELPPGYEAQIRSRSGLALKHGIQVLNAPGTVDPAYRGELGVILVWNGHNPTKTYSRPNTQHPTYAVWPLPSDAYKLEHVYEIKKGDRIAQMVIAKYEPVTWNFVTELSDSERGEGGFGSTGR